MKLYKNFLKLKNKQIKFNGFTLIEVLVSVALFTIIITLAMGALFSAQTVNARLQANQSILDGMNLSFEIMTRDIRYGTIFNCGTVVPVSKAEVDSFFVLKRKSCPFDISGSSLGAGTVIIFKPVDAVDPDDRIGYYATSSKIYKWSYVANVVDDPKPVTSDEVNINVLHFFLTGANTTQQAVDNGNVENSASTTDTLQPVVNVMVIGKTIIKKEGAEKVNFQLQTTVAPRGIDN